jgi:hypothetical protein
VSYNYSQLVAELAVLTGASPTTTAFTTELPNAIDYGEQRIFRDLDLLATVIADHSQVCTPSTRIVNVPGNIVSINDVNIITPAGVAPGGGLRNPLVRVSQSVLDLLYPSPTVATVPEYYCYQFQGYGGSQGNILLGPFPDQNYTVEYIGTARPTPLSASNPNTFLATNLPDLFLVACMIHMAAYQKNWSSIGNDPAGAVGYETQYQKLLVGASAEEIRKRYAGTTMIPPAGLAEQPSSPDAKP